MDRINGADTTDIGAGRRGFRAENLVAGVSGTEVTADFLNSVQEEILRVVTEAGLVPDAADWSQLWQALRIIGLTGLSRGRRWMAVISMTLTSAPGAPTQGDAYLVPAGATGIWAANVGKIAEWTGSAWSYSTPSDGHGIALADGRVFERVAGTYIEKIALDHQSGKWSYAIAAGTANSLTATLTPAPSVLVEGMIVRIKVALKNTGAVTLNLNGLGAVALRDLYDNAASAGDLVAGAVIELIYKAGYWQYSGTWRSSVQSRAAPRVALFLSSGTWTVPDDVTVVTMEAWGGGGGGGASTADQAGSGGGGSGYGFKRTLVAPGDVMSIQIGAAGAAGAAGGGNGGDGGATIIVNFMQVNGGLGGRGGSVASSNRPPGNGGTVPTSDFGFTGGTGSGWAIASSGQFGGAGGASPRGGPGGLGNNGGSGGTGSLPGGGGGAAGTGNGPQAGGVGGSGLVIIRY